MTAVAETTDLLSLPDFARADEYAGAWAIDPHHAQSLWAQAQRLPESHFSGTQALAQSRTSRKSGVAIIPVVGVLMKQQSSIGASTSTVQLRRDIRNAANSADVDAILLVIDSPGGAVAGTSDVAREIRAARKLKPVYAQVQDLCASASYWIASQCEKIYAENETTMVGSIGTILTIHDYSGMYEKEGVKTLMFRTGPLKGAGTPGTAIDEAQQKHFQGLVDKIQTSFDAEVMSGRGIGVEQLAAVKTGGVFLADEALQFKLIDGIQTIDATVSQISEGKPSHIAISHQSTTSSKGNPSMPENIENKTEPSLAFDAAAARAAVTAETVRVEKLRATCERLGNPKLEGGESIFVHAVENGWSIEKAELECYRNTRATAHAQASISATTATPAAVGEVIEAAIAQAGGLQRLEKHYSEQTLDRAHKQFKSRISLQEALIHGARANGHTDGWHIRSNADLRTALQYAFPQSPQAAGFSTFGLSGIFANVANKFLLQGFDNHVDGVWGQICARVSAKDFKTITRYRVASDMTFQPIGADGEIHHGTMSESSRTLAIDTYALMYAVTRKHFIDDDLGALSDIPSRLGRGGALTVNEKFWETWLDNSTFFANGNNNLSTGAFSSANLKALELKFMKQTDEYGNPMVITPVFLVVPPDIKRDGLELMSSSSYITGSDVKIGNYNSFQGAYQVLSSPYLSNSAFTGYSTTAYYLLASPSVLPTIEGAFLNGREAPVVETADADFNVLGVQMRGYFDFGFEMAEYRGGAKSTGV